MQKANTDIALAAGMKREGIRDGSDFFKKVTPFLGLIVVFAIFATTTEGKFTAFSNLQLILIQSAMTMVAGIGVTFVMAHGNLDFSLGGELAICAVVGIFASRITPWMALPATILTGIVCSSFVAVVHNVMRVPTFVVGLCIMFLGRGIATAAAATDPMRTPNEISALDNIWFYLITVVAVYIIAYFIYEYTKIGKYNRVIGSNEKAAMLSGVPVSKYKLIAFTITGVCLGIAAFMSLIRVGSATGQTGTSFEINVLIALVLGGVSLTGGSSVKMRSIIVGTLIYMMLNNGLTLLGVNPNLINSIKTVVFLASVYAAYDRSSSAVPV